MSLACLAWIVAPSFAMVLRSATVNLPRVQPRVMVNTMALADIAEETLRRADELATSRLIRLANHGTAIASLAYFGLVSSTMQMPSMRMPMADLAGLITRRVGPTSNSAFARAFPTLVTPASYVFLIWPAIAALQLLTLAVSILRPTLSGSAKNSLSALKTVATGPPLSQTELAALSLANVVATMWLFVSSNALAGSLPLANALILPLVPILSGYPLRRQQQRPGNLAAAGFARGQSRSIAALDPLYRPVFEVFSSFTAIATCLAFAIECQYGRVPLLAGQSEACALVFLSLVGALISLPKRTIARRTVTCFALSGVVARRLQISASISALLSSPSFLVAVVLWVWSAKKLAGGE